VEVVVRRLVLALALAGVLAFPVQVSASQRDEGGSDAPRTATGVLVQNSATGYPYGTHAVIDESSGTEYALQSETVPLGDFVGERVRVGGTLEKGQGEPALMNVTRVERDPPASTVQNSIRGYITDVSPSARVVLVEEDPSDASGSEKGEFAVAGGTAIFKQRDGERSVAAFDDLRAGQLVEALYAGPVAESYPTQGLAGNIVILDDSQSAPPGDIGPSVLPDTGGVRLPVIAVVLLISGVPVYLLAGLSRRRRRNVGGYLT
jgi:hypothetical protein